jgi:dephospho-CoA kinase
MVRTGTKPIAKPALVVGVAGIMGSGKSTVARVFEDEGAKLIDADIVGRELLGEEKIREEIVGAFGRRVIKPGGEIDTAKLGRLAFRAPESARELDRITRKELIARLRSRIGALKASADVVVVDAALLPEWHPREWIDLLVVVDSDEESAIRRAASDPRFRATDVRARMKHQFSRKDKAREADVIIPNFGSLEDLKERARTVFRTLLDVAGKE